MTKQQGAPSEFTPRLLKKDVLALPAYGGVERRLAQALHLSAQAVNRWGDYIHPSRVYQVLYLHPELKRKVTQVRVKFKAVRKVHYVRVRP
jgi:hypothetical protein